MNGQKSTIRAMPGILRQELLLAIRILMKRPAFSIVAILTMSLGIGANTAIFSLVDAVLFRPLPIRDPGRVVRVFASEPDGTNLSNSSYPVFTDYRDQAKCFDGIATYSNWNSVDLSVRGQKPERVNGALVSGNFFELLGLLPSQGRLFTGDDDRVAGNHPVIVLSNRFWNQRFAGDPRVVGSTVLINGHPFTIVGVTRPDFFGVGLDGLPQLWMPTAMLDQAQPQFAGSLTNRSISWVDMVARLKPAVTIEQAQAELRTIAAVRASSQPEDRKDPSATLMSARNAATQWDLLPSAPTVSWVLLGVVLLVLLISCAVTAGLFLVRSEQRHKEIVVRLALGASRGRIIRQLLLESLMLSMLAAVAGLFLAGWTTDLLIAASPAEFPIPLDAASPIVDPRVMAFTMGVSIFSGILFGLSPAIRASRFQLMDALKSHVSFLGSSRVPLRSLFVIVQVALSAVLLTGAGLLLRTLWKANSVDPGFRLDHGLVASLDLAKEGYTGETGPKFYSLLLDQIRGIGGVKSVALGRTIPVQNSGMRITIHVDGPQPRNITDQNADFNIVTTGFFATLKIPLLYGRDFSAADGKNAPQVAIVNETLARQYWPGENATGKLLKDVGLTSGTVEIVGVVGDARYRNLRTPAAPMLYLPLDQCYMPSMSFVIRIADQPEAVLPAIASTVARLDNHLPLFAVSTLEQKISTSLAQERMIAGLLSAFGILALLLAAIGIYTLISYTTALRTREFGIRMALGAERKDVLSLVLSRGMVLTSAGLIVGLSAALGLGRMIESLLFNVSPADLPTLTAIVILMATVSMVACYLPAQRATRVNPTEALRYE
jgi:predicted permease